MNQFINFYASRVSSHKGLVQRLVSTAEYAVMTMILFVLSTVRAAGSVVELQSGHIISTDEVSFTATITATSWYNANLMDNLVAATTATTQYATAHGYSTCGTSSVDGLPATAPADMTLKTFWSDKLNDTLTTGSAEGLAWAADPLNGYVFQRDEGSCNTVNPGPSSVTSVVSEYVQLWSTDRSDSFLVEVGSPQQKNALSAKYIEKWHECYIVGPGVPGATGLWTRWNNTPPAGGIPYPQSKDLLGWEYLSGANPGYGGGNLVASSADTWYPTWSSDGNLYTPWTDGHVHDDATGQTISSGSGGSARDDYNSTTGQAVIVGNDPFKLNITQVATFTASTYPYQGRYPCGSLMKDDTWFYGTYYLDNPNASIGGNYVGPSPDPNCGNWCIQGPVVDFRVSTDKGKTWKEERVKATSGSDNLFGETAANNTRVKFGAPHWVDFGMNMELSPDGKAYLIGHGGAPSPNIQAWMLGDNIHMARVVPTVANIADKSKWEFYAGGNGADAKWVTGDISAALPILDWVHHTGTTTMTYFPGIKKYILTTSTATNWPMMTEQFDTYFMESDSITGPWSYVTYMSKFGPEAYFVNHPSKFSAARANTTSKSYDAFLMYSANFAYHNGAIPPNSGYHMNLQQARFPLSDSFAAKLADEYAAADAIQQ
jgi:hypothetical protein